MAPLRRKTRATASSCEVIEVAKPLMSPKKVASPRTRGSQQTNISYSPSSVKSVKPVSDSACKTRSQASKDSSPVRKSLAKSTTPTRAVSKSHVKSTTPKTSISKSLAKPVIPTRSASKTLPKPITPSKPVSKIVEKSPSRALRTFKETPLNPAQKQVSEDNSARKARQSPAGVISSAARNSKTRCETTDSTKPIPYVSPQSPLRVRSTRGTSVVNCQSTAAKKELVKSPPVKSPRRAPVSPSKQSQECSPKRHISSPRKRLLPSPSKSPQSAKTRRLKGNNSSPVLVKNDPDENCAVEDTVKKDMEDFKNKIASLTNVPKLQNPDNLKTKSSLTSGPELTDRFLRKKWFSLKTRGGFTCLRSAILSPEEIANEVLQHTMTETPKEQDANFFTTKLMMRLSSRLPPTRARPSCEELVDLINSRSKKIYPLMEPKSESTAIRVKVEKRSFTDTISHVSSKPSQTMENPPCTSKAQVKAGVVFRQGDSHLTKKQERDIALLQLKNLKNC